MFTVKQPYHTNEIVSFFADDQKRKSEKAGVNNYRHREDKNQNIDRNVENISAGDDKGGQKETKDKSQMVLGIVVGAGVVIFVLVCILVGYRVYSKRRRRDSKKYQYQQPSHGIPSQVTLLPIQSVAATRGHSRMDLSAQGVERGQLTRLVAPLNRTADERARVIPGAQGQGQFDLRSPPPYNESFLDNGGSVVAV